MTRQRNRSVSALTPAEARGFYRELLSLAIPIGLQNLLVALIGATDALMLGRLAQDAVSAVSLANQIVFIMNLFVGSIVSGGGALMAQYWGRDDRAMVKNLFCMILKWSLGVSSVFFALALLIPQHLMRIYTTEPALIEIGASYLRAVSASYLFSAVTQCYFLKMKLEGRASRSVVISVVTLVTDVVLDAFLIYGLAGVPALGADGSAYSTVAVELIALVWCVAESHRGESIRVDAQGLRWFSATITRDWLGLALPMLSSALAWGLSITTHALIMGRMGSDATAAASITSVVIELVTCVCKGISAGAGIMIGRLLGQSLFERAKVYGRAFCHLSLLVGLVHTLLLCALGPVMALLFVLTPTAQRYLVAMLVFSGLYVFAFSVNTVVVCGIFPAGGDSRYDAISVFFATWCFAIPLALLAKFVFGWPVMAVYVLMRMDEIVKVPWLYPRYKKYLWLNNLTRTEQER